MIIVKYNNSSSTEVCSISGEAFYLKEGIGFYSDAIPKKLVCPEIAPQKGFTMDKELLYFFIF